MKTSNKDYEKIRQISRYARILGGVSSILDWDQETYLPDGASGIRGEQIETLAGIIHKEKTSKKFERSLSKLIDIETGAIKALDLDKPHIAALKEWRRDFKRDTALPRKFVEQFAKLTSQSLMVWREAKKEDSFSKFAPYLDKIITLSKKKAEYLGYKDHPYDALLDLYEPDATSKEIKQLFGSLKLSIVDLLKKIQACKQIDNSALYGNYDKSEQIDFSNKLLTDMGYALTKGRLDISTHPFSSSSHPTDCRITTRIDTTNFLSNILTVLHEAGHAMYEMGLPIEEYGTPLSEAISHGIHESQSRWWETRIGQSKPYWQHYLPLLKKQFKGKINEITLDDFYRAINKVQPSFIRVGADEVTYPLHVILRFELELELIGGTLRVRDIPEAWNAKMNQLLGITPQNNSEGCLQDVHWAMGGFGYFPSYTIGNLYAAHLFKAFEAEFPEWEKQVAKGELLFIRDWLSRNIYQYGRQYNGPDLLKKVTGKAFSANAYIEYLQNKYTKIYCL